MIYNNNLYTDIGVTTTYPTSPYGIAYSGNPISAVGTLITSPITMTTDNPDELKINVKKKPIKFNFNL